MEQQRNFKKSCLYTRIAAPAAVSSCRTFTPSTSCKNQLLRQMHMNSIELKMHDKDVVP